MEGAIELPSEANPLNHQFLLDALTRASSANPQQVKTSTQQLQNWEKQRGYYSSLQSVSLDTSLPHDVRYLSAIQLKNGIDKYWRKTASNAVTKEEKALIRSRLLDSGMKEPIYSLALQNALIIAKVARFDFPHDWPGVITSVIQPLHDTSQTGGIPTHVFRTLLVLLHIIKELSTARLQRSQASLQNAAPEVFRVTGKVYIEFVNQWLPLVQRGATDTEVLKASTSQSLLTLRVLRRLIVAGYEFPNRHKEVQEFWSITRSHFGEMLTIVTHNGRAFDPETRISIEKHLVQLSKLHLEMAKVRPAAFALLPTSIDLTKEYWGLISNLGNAFRSDVKITSGKIEAVGNLDEEDTPCLEMLCLKGLLLVRACAKMVYSPTQTFKYQQAQDKEERKRATALVKDSLLIESMIREMMETLVTQFFVFRPKDLREWEDEPEEWERREEGDSDVWEFSIRSCAEKLFLDLVINNKDLLILPLLNVFYAVATPQNTDIFLKDSIYSAIGLAAPVLENHLDFATFLGSTLVPEIQVQQPGYNILRRRIAIVLGQWLVIKEGLNRPLVYQIFQYLLDKEDKLNDQVVRVTAGRQLKNIIDPFEFTSEPFMPYATAILNHLMNLIQEVALSETKMALLHTLSVIVVKMEHHIDPFASQIISLLPPLWDQATDAYLLKQTILAILSALITALGPSSIRFHPLILPLIESSIASDLPSTPYLLDDALDLWAAVLASAPSSTPELLTLTPSLFPHLTLSADSLRTILPLLASYTLLAPAPLLTATPAYLPLLAPLLTPPFGPPSGPASLTTSLLELLLRCAHALSGPAGTTELASLLLDTNILPTVIAALHSAHSSHAATGPNRPRNTLDPLLETDLLALFARIALSSPQIFVDALSTLAQPLTETLEWLLTEWCRHLDNVGHPGRKKLLCLGLTNLLVLDPPPKWLLGRLQELMAVWMDVVGECVEWEVDDGGDRTGVGKDTLVWGEEGMVEGESAEDGRKRVLEGGDVVHQLDIRVFIGERVRSVVGRVGEEVFRREWLEGVDKEVVRGFGELGIL